MANRKTSNRSAEAAVKTEEVPKDGTTWEKVRAPVGGLADRCHREGERVCVCGGTLRPAYLPRRCRRFARREVQLLWHALRYHPAGANSSFGTCLPGRPPSVPAVL